MARWPMQKARCAVFDPPTENDTPHVIMAEAGTGTENAWLSGAFVGVG